MQTFVGVRIRTVSAASSDTDLRVKQLIALLNERHLGSEVASGQAQTIYVFQTAKSAMDWCFDFQTTLATEEWTLAHGEQLVALFMHRGLAEGPTLFTDGRRQLQGPGIDCVHELSPLIHYGQIVMSSGTWRDIHQSKEQLKQYTDLHLGKHHLRCHPAPCAVIQVMPVALNGRTFPPLELSSTARTNLPAHEVGFFGREEQLKQIDELRANGRRLFVLKGPGGIGKSRLAAEYGQRCLSGTDNGVWRCDCTDTRSISGVVHSLASVLNVPLTVRGLQATNQLGNALAARGPMLVILDNFDHLVEYSDLTIGHWSRRAPDVTFILTTRTRIEHSGVMHIDLPPLETEAALSLFEDRASRASEDFVLTEDSVVVVSDLLQRLENNPLAIILASAWSNMLSVNGILDRVAQGLKYLAGSNVGGVENRHGSLRSVVEWSWNLLQAHEQDALAQCSVFVGGFTLEAAEAVVDLSRHRQTPPVSQILRKLIDHSMLEFMDVNDIPDQVRLCLYNSVREYAEERLATMGHRPATEARHGEYFLKFGESKLDNGALNVTQTPLAVLAIELDNFIAAQRRSRGRGTTLASRLALVADTVLSIQGPFDVHLEVLEEGTRYANEDQGQLTSDILTARAEVLYRHGRYDEAVKLLRRAIESADSIPDGNSGSAHSLLGLVLYRSGAIEAGTQELLAAIQIFKENGDRRKWGIALGRTGSICAEIGQLNEADKRLSAAKDVFESIHDSRNFASVLGQLGNVRRAQGDPAGSLKLYGLALQMHEEMGDSPNKGRVLAYMGSLLLDLNRLDEAEKQYTDALEIFECVGDARQAGIVNGNMGRLMHHRGLPAEALNLYRKGIDQLKTVNDLRFQSLFEGTIGALLHEMGKMKKAKETYSVAIHSLKTLGDKRFQALNLARLGALEADLGEIDAAKTCFRRSWALLEAIQDPLGQKAVAIHEAHLWVALAKRGSDPEKNVNTAVSIFRTMSGQQGAAGGRVSQTSDIRLGLRLLRNALKTVMKS